MSGEVEIEGIDELLATIADMRALKPLRATLAAIGVDLVGRVSPYPAAPAGSRYKRGIDRRSEGLGRRWTTQQEANGDVVIGNNASYAGWVHDEELQTRVHQRTGWLTVQGEWEKAIPEYEQMLAANYELAIKRGA